ncbi:MAG: DUF5678 domain-containing protein, partial [Candidatus Poribacteria bacterium]
MAERERTKQEKRETRRSASVWSDDIELYSDPVNDWIAEQSAEWSQKYEGKYLAIVDYQVVAVEDTRKAAYEKSDKLCPERFYETDLEKVPMVLYVPR